MEGVSFEAPSTKKVAAALKAMNLAGSTLLVTTGKDDLLYRSARNIVGVAVRAAADVNAYDLLSHKNLVLVNGSLEALLKAAGPATTKVRRQP